MTSRCYLMRLLIICFAFCHLFHLPRIRYQKYLLLFRYESSICLWGELFNKEAVHCCQTVYYQRSMTAMYYLGVDSSLGLRFVLQWCIKAGFFPPLSFVNTNCCISTLWCWSFHIDLPVSTMRLCWEAFWGAGLLLQEMTLSSHFNFLQGELVHWFTLLIPCF